MVAGAVVGVRGYLDTEGPGGTVRAYFAALQRGDAAAALGYGAPPAGDRSLLISSVLADQQRLAPLRGVRVGRVHESQDGLRASVAVRYHLDFPTGARPAAATLALHRGEDGWRLDRTAVSGSVALQEAGALASIAGRPLPSGTLTLFPGAVPVRLASPYLQLDTAAAIASVGFTGANRIDLPVRASAAGVRAVRAATSRALAECADGNDVTCPLPGAAYVPGSLHGRIGRTAQAPAGTRLTVRLRHSSAGVFDIDGETGFTGSYRTLTYDDQQQRGSGSARLTLHAQAVATAPLRVQWSAS